MRGKIIIKYFCFLKLCEGPLIAGHIFFTKLKNTSMLEDRFYHVACRQTQDVYCSSEGICSEVYTWIIWGCCFLLTLAKQMKNVIRISRNVRSLR